MFFFKCGPCISISCRIDWNASISPPLNTPTEIHAHNNIMIRLERPKFTECVYKPMSERGGACRDIEAFIQYVNVLKPFTAVPNELLVNIVVHVFSSYTDL